MHFMHYAVTPATNTQRGIPSQILYYTLYKYMQYGTYYILYERLLQYKIYWIKFIMAPPGYYSYLSYVLQNVHTLQI